MERSREEKLFDEVREEQILMSVDLDTPELEIKGFKKFSSIKSPTHQKTRLAIYNQGLHRVDWIATEKVHGANFSFWFSPSEGLKCAKRTSFLEEGDLFYGWESLKSLYAENVKQLWCSLIKNSKESETPLRISIFGELCGGEYPGFSNSHRVQKGVWYSPTFQFLAFDVFVETAVGSWYMNPALSRALLAENGFLLTPEIARGKLNDLLDIKANFESIVPEMWSLPKLPKNGAEGFVLLPFIRSLRDELRCIFKVKSEDFMEIIQKKKRTQQKKKFNPLPNLSEEELAISEGLADRITQKRFEAVFSKELEDIKIQKLVGLMIRDILASYREEHLGRFESLNKMQRKRLIHILTKVVVSSVMGWAL